MKKKELTAEDLSKNFTDIKRSLNLADKKIRLNELEAKALDQHLWDDQENAKKIMQELGDLQAEIREIEDLEAEINTLNELAQLDSGKGELDGDIRKILKKLESLKVKSYLSQSYDKKNALVSIHAGQGGTEAMDWSSMLLRMYLRFSERKNWKTEIVDISEGEEAGLKSVIFRVEGPYAYGYLKGEMGTHRLVRQSPFNADKLRQTSFALVEVLPELESTDLPELQIKDDDLEWQFFRSSSKGGQNVQKVSTAVRLTHKPTGIVVTSQTQRFQLQNRQLALDLLRAKLWAREQARKEEQKEKLKGEYRPASWGTQIRSYVLHPYKMVKDLRTEVETSNTEGVLDGELDEFIEAELREG